MALLVAVILLWPGSDEEQRQPEDTARAPQSGERQSSEPRLGSPADGRTERMPGRRGPPPAGQPYPMPGEVRPYAPRWQEPPPPERFTFRPLTEREKERLDQRSRDDPYYDPYGYAYPQAPRRGGYGAPQYQAEPPPPEYGARRYGDYYGHERAPAPRSYPRPEPYRAPRDPGYEEPWTTPADPLWGAQPPEWYPPSRRMYPSLQNDPGNRLTAAP